MYIKLIDSKRERTEPSGFKVYLALAHSQYIWDLRPLGSHTPGELGNLSSSSLTWPILNPHPSFLKLDKKGREIRSAAVKIDT